MRQQGRNASRNMYHLERISNEVWLLTIILIVGMPVFDIFRQHGDFGEKGKTLHPAARQFHEGKQSFFVSSSFPLV
jgi:hypothetical protein